MVIAADKLRWTKPCDDVGQGDCKCGTALCKPMECAWRGVRDGMHAQRSADDGAWSPFWIGKRQHEAGARECET